MEKFNFCALMAVYTIERLKNFQKLFRKKIEIHVAKNVSARVIFLNYLSFQNFKNI